MLEVLTKVFTDIVNNFYISGVSVSLSDTPDTAYCTDKHIVLPKHLLEEFTNQKLPRFTVLYHELGHALYSNNMTTLIEKWSNLPAMSNLTYQDKYHHLINWIEDLFIEEQLVKNYSYLHDLISCLKKLTLPYDINAIDKAFNHYYVKGHASPTLSNMDAVRFTNYINTLLNLRKANSFGKGPISILSAKSKETQYIKTLIEFYDWCVVKGIFDDNTKLPPLTNPNMTTQKSFSDKQNTGDKQSTNDKPEQGGSCSDHSHLVGGIKEALPNYNPKELEIFNDLFIAEQKMIKAEIAKQFKTESSETSLDGLFNSTYKDSSIIQPKVNVPNFFNPNRLLDQVLFKTPNKCFNNVSIYRDVSGSTEGERFYLINEICKYINEKLPIAYNFYLYASGPISIVQTTFEDWEDRSMKPDVYENDPLVQQLRGGTNSDAIADVITEQLNDKWLNIIITDGDLHALMNRDNIASLLDNIFVISVCNSVWLNDVPNKMTILDETQIADIPREISCMRGVF